MNDLQITYSDPTLMLTQGSLTEYKRVREQIIEDMRNRLTSQKYPNLFFTDWDFPIYPQILFNFTPPKKKRVQLIKTAIKDTFSVIASDDLFI